MPVRFASRWLLTVSTILAVAGCANTAAQDLAGSEWRPRTIDGEVPGQAAEQIVRFEADGKLAGSGGCNNFFGSYELKENSIEISPLGMTRKMCSEAVMALETGLINALQKARSVERHKTELGLYDEQGKLLGSFVQTDWD